MAVNRELTATPPLWRRLLPAASLLALAAGCAEEPAQTARVARAKPVVLTSSWPIWSLASRIVGDGAQVECLLAPGNDARVFQPDRALLAAMGDADLVLLNGADLESWAATVSLPSGRTVDLSKPLESELLEIEGAICHSHGPGEAHTHDGRDPHYWLDPALAERLVRGVRQALGTVVSSPDVGARMDAEVVGILDELEQIDALIAGLPAPVEGEVLVATHPTWGYVARRVGWKVEDVPLDLSAGLNDAQVALLKRRFSEVRPRVVLWEAAPQPEVAERLEKEFGAPSVVFSADALRSESELDLDTVARLRSGVEALAAAMR
ncbi:MAG: metal ABC transporter substrate-binding protein [Planctomycetota bacterium]|nr:metal ABC transporter substrate-binding protein [Planctomycetota bacterium]MDA1222803.1 metal ABC transporter substrate-binding protein [Planctomycetota bacterium]